MKSAVLHPTMLLTIIRLRWGRAIENYWWPFTSPLFVLSVSVDVAFWHTVSTFATVSANCFPLQVKANGKDFKLLQEGVGWLRVESESSVTNVSQSFLKKLASKCILN
jgi:hypothetical protein